MDLQQSLTDLLIVTLIAALTPILAGLLSRLRVPQVVILILGGILVGPQGLGWAEPEGIELISNVGLGSCFSWRVTNSSSGCSGRGPGGLHCPPGW